MHCCTFSGAKHRPRYTFLSQKWMWCWEVIVLVIAIDLFIAQPGHSSPPPDPLFLKDLGARYAFAPQDRRRDSHQDNPPSALLCPPILVVTRTHAIFVASDRREETSSLRSTPSPLSSAASRRDDARTAAEIVGILGGLALEEPHEDRPLAPPSPSPDVERARTPFHFFAEAYPPESQEPSVLAALPDEAAGHADGGQTRAQRNAQKKVQRGGHRGAHNKAHRRPARAIRPAHPQKEVAAELPPLDLPPTLPQAAAAPHAPRFMAAPDLGNDSDAAGEQIRAPEENHISEHDDRQGRKRATAEPGSPPSASHSKRGRLALGASGGPILDALSTYAFLPRQAACSSLASAIDRSEMDACTPPERCLIQGPLPFHE